MAEDSNLVSQLERLVAIQDEGWFTAGQEYEARDAMKAAMREITRMQSEIERLSRFADFLCRQDWTSRGRAIAEEAFMNAIAMDKEAGFPQPESRDG